MKELIENPRFLDRLNAVCTVLMAMVLLTMLVLALQSGSLASVARGISGAQGGASPSAALASAPVSG